MGKKILTILLMFSLVTLSSACFAENNLWEQKYINALQKGVAATITVDHKGGGLGYTPSKETILEDAIKDAIAMKAPSCQMMKIAIDMKYNPYSVIKNIFSFGGEVDLNQLCMCATESGINKQIIAKAAEEAASPLGKPIYSRDEIAQAQCLKEIGLGYTPSAITIPPAIRAPGKVAEVFSQSSASVQ